MCVGITILALGHIRVERVAQPIAHEGDGEHGEENGEAGQGGQPPRHAHASTMSAARAFHAGRCAIKEKGPLG